MKPSFSKNDQKELIKLGNIATLCDMLWSDDCESREYALSILEHNTEKVGKYIRKHERFLESYYENFSNNYFDVYMNKLRDFQRKINYLKKLKQ